MSIDYTPFVSLSDGLVQVNLEEVMVAPALTLYEDQELSEAEELFIQQGIFYLPVLSRENKVVGLLSRRYIYKTRSPRKIMNKDMQYAPGILVDGDSYYNKDVLDSYILRQVMVPNPLTLGPKDSLAQAVLIMAKRKIGCIPIVREDKSICGVISEQEIIQFFADIIAR